MNAYEREIEAKLKDMVQHWHGRCLKWTSPGNSGVPDRIVLLPGGHVIFVECKRPKDYKVSSLQEFWQKELRSMGFQCEIVKSMEDLDRLETLLIRYSIFV